jgi:hypothetical protein
MTTYCAAALGKVNNSNTAAGVRTIGKTFAAACKAGEGRAEVSNCISEATQGQAARLTTIAVALQLLETAATDVSTDAAFTSLAAGVQAEITAALAAIAGL